MTPKEYLKACSFHPSLPPPKFAFSFKRIFFGLLLFLFPETLLLQVNDYSQAGQRILRAAQLRVLGVYGQDLPGEMEEAP